jgi:hypothetical protein
MKEDTMNTSTKRSYGRRALHIAGWVIAGIGLAVVFALVFGLVVQWCWNWLMPELFGLKTITFWQAFVLVILGKLVVGGFHPRHGHHHKSVWRKGDYHPATAAHYEYWKYYGDFWEKEGRASFERYVENLKNGGEAKK